MDWPNVNRSGCRMESSTSTTGYLGLTAGTGYQTVFASLPFASKRVIVDLFEAAGGTIKDWLVDLAIGASLSEIPVASSLLYSEISGDPNCVRFDFPLGLPAGERLSARANSSLGTTSIGIVVTAIGGGWDTRTTSRILTVGADVGGVGGTGIVPGASNVKGAYSVLTASLAAPIRGFCFAMGTQANNDLSDRNYHLDLAIGTGPEIVLVPNVCLSTMGVEQHPLYVSPWLDIALAAGTPISARMAGSAATLLTNWDIILYGGVS